MEELSVCLICREEASATDPFVAACKCTGTLKYHKSCLESYAKNHETCSVCKQKYKWKSKGITKINRCLSCFCYNIAISFIAIIILLAFSFQIAVYTTRPCYDDQHTITTSEDKNYLYHVKICTYSTITTVIIEILLFIFFLSDEDTYKYAVVLLIYGSVSKFIHLCIHKFDLEIGILFTLSFHTTLILIFFLTALFSYLGDFFKEKIDRRRVPPRNLVYVVTEL